MFNIGYAMERRGKGQNSWSLTVNWPMYFSLVKLEVMTAYSDLSSGFVWITLSYGIATMSELGPRQNRELFL